MAPREAAAVSENSPRGGFGFLVAKGDLDDCDPLVEAARASGEALTVGHLATYAQEGAGGT